MFKKIVFLGGKSVGCGVLNHLLMMDEPVVGVLGNPEEDNAWYPAIKDELLNHHKIHYSEVDRDWDFIRALAPDLIVVAYYDGILPKDIIELPKHGCINLHLADVEKYRGCYPTVHAVLNGDKKYGVTIHKIDEGIDTGDILVRWNFDIDEDMTGRELYDRASRTGVRMFQYFWDAYKAGKIVATPQKPGAQHNSRILPGKEVAIPYRERRRILALDFPPFEPTYIQIGSRRYRIHEDSTS